MYWLVHFIILFAKTILCIARFESKNYFTCLFQATPRKRFRRSHHHRRFAQWSHYGSFGCTKCNGGGSASYSSTCSTARCQTRSNACDVGYMTDMTHIPSLHIPFNLVARGCILLVFTRSIPFQSKSFLSPTLSGAVRIISADGTVLDPTLPIDRAGLQSGDTVTAVALPPAKLLPLCFKTFKTFNIFVLCFWCSVSWRSIHSTGLLAYSQGRN